MRGKKREWTPFSRKVSNRQRPVRFRSEKCDFQNETINNLFIKQGKLHSKNTYFYKNCWSRSYLIPVSCAVALLLVMGACINPVISSGEEKVYAVDGVSTQAEGDIVPENGVALRIDTALNSNNTVEEQVTGNGTQYIKVDFTVGANNIQNYDVYVQADSTALTGLSHGDKLQSINSNSVGTVGNMQWGYAVSQGVVEPSTMTYKPIQTSALTSADGQDAGSGKTLTGISQPYTLAFAANLTGATADHYKSNITLSVAAGASDVVHTWDSMVYMQDMNHTACASQPTPAADATDVPTKTLIDSRDDNTYTIAKLKDGNCWMTQNLEIINKTITPADSDMEAGKFVVPSSSLSGFGSGGRYFPAVYWSSYGGHYNWYTATAGTGDANFTEAGANAPGSICPSGWRLPTGGDAVGEFYNIFSNVTAAEIVANPYYLTYGGYIGGNGSLSFASSRGWYWSSTVGSMTNYAYYLSASTDVNPSVDTDRYVGMTVRCVAR